MGSRLKEDEKNERIIRSLLKLPENRRCINCNSLGPQYVCTNFRTFVCTTCSGIHREFTHRVKSVSMAKFTSQEVSSLQEGGNKRAKEVYFKEWDSERHSFPDSSNVERLRDFIRHVYVDRRFSGERNFDKPPAPRAKMGDKEDSNENRRLDTYQGGSRSPPYEDSYERRYSDRSSPGARSYGERSPGARSYGERSPGARSYGERSPGARSYGERSPGGRSYGERSPGYDQESRQHGEKRSPARPDVVNDWRREDRFGNALRSEDRRISEGDAKLEGRSPDRQKDLDTSSPPMVRPVREILGDNVVPLRISEPPKANGGRTADGSAHTQRTASSSSLGSTNGNPAENKWGSSGSLIDFDADPEPPASAPQTQQPAAIPTNSPNDNNWASFDFAPEAKVTPAPSNPLDSVLSELSVPASIPSNLSGINGVVSQTTGPVVNDLLSVGGDANVGPTGHTLPFSAGSSAVAPPNSSLSAFPPSGTSAAIPGLMEMLPANGGHWPSMQHQQPSMFPASGIQSSFTPFGGASSNQPWNLSPNAQGALSTPAAQAHPAVSKPAQELTSGVASQTPLEVKSSERQVLPEDLFSLNYSSMSAPSPGWRAGPPYGMGFNMQYNTGAPLPTYPQSSQSTNPFDVGNEPPPVQAQAFPSMASMQSALPNLPPPSNLHRTSSLGAPSPAWNQPQPYASVMTPQASPYASALPQAPSYTSAIPPRPYMGQQLPTNMMPSRPQGHGNFVSEGASFASMNPDQQMAGRYSAPATPNPYASVGGNPFG